MEVNGQLHTQTALPPGGMDILVKTLPPPTPMVFDVQLYIYGCISKQFCYKHSFAPYTCQLYTNNKTFTLTQVVTRLSVT